MEMYPVKVAQESKVELKGNGDVYKRQAHEQSDDQYFKDLDEHWTTMSGLFDEHKWDIEDILDVYKRQQ